MMPAARPTRPGQRARIAGLAGVAAVVVALGADARPQGQQAATAGLPGPPTMSVPGLRPTAHDPVPAELSGYWLTLASGNVVTPALRDFARAVEVIDDGGDARSVAPLLQSAALDASPVADYVRYYRGLAALAADDLATAEAVFADLAGRGPAGIATDAMVRLGETHERQGRYAAAAAAYTRALAGRPTEPDRLAHKLGVAHERAGDASAAIAAHRRVYFDYPLSPDGEASGDALSRLGAPMPTSRAASRAKRRGPTSSTARADGRWLVPAYGRVYDLAEGDARAAAAVRAAAADVQLKQYRGAVERLRPLAAEGAHQAEARLHLALAARGQGQMDAYERGVRELVAAFPGSPYAEEALNALATSLVVGDDDAGAAAIFGEMVTAFPAGRFAERAAWKAGWWAYRQGTMGDAVRYFEAGAANFPRSDYRPPWLYWSARPRSSSVTPPAPRRATP